MHIGQPNIYIIQAEITGKGKLGSRNLIQLKFYQGNEIYISL